MSVAATIDNDDCSIASVQKADQKSSSASLASDSYKADHEVTAPLEDDHVSFLTTRNDANPECGLTDPSSGSVSGEKTCVVSKPTAGQPAKTRKRGKQFSRRKDVIIKTLLRKCRKFLTNDFNARTDYIRQKRRLTNKIYFGLLRNYLHSIVSANVSDKLVAFLGAFLYQQDLETTLDSFASPSLTSAEVQEQSDKIHDVLYRYSHQKFRVFIAEHSELTPIFMHFYHHGCESLRDDLEYAAGLEIVKDQLHSSLQEC